jgi:hypothetical protein
MAFKAFHFCYIYTLVIRICMRTSILSGVIYLLSHFAYGQTFQLALGGAQEEFAYAVQQTEDNGYIVAGRTFSFGTGGWECYLTRFNAAGDTLWTKTYGNVLYDEFQDVDTTSDGGFIAVGHTTTTDWDGNLYLVRTNANGIVVWSKEYGGAIGLSDKGYSVRETSDGGFIVTGTTETYGMGGDDVYVLKVGSTGTVQWTTTIGSAGTTSVMDAGREIQETNDGGYIVVGYTSAIDINFSEVYLIKLNSLGIVQWKKTYGGGSYDIGYTVQQTSDNGYIIGATTNSYGAGNWDAMLIKTDANGTLQWTKTYGKSGEDRAQCARQTADGGYILCGRSSSFGAGSFDLVLYKTDANGALLWTKGYGGAGDDQGFYVREIGSSFVFCGYTVSFGAGIKDVFLGRTDTNGSSGCNEITGSGFTTTSPTLSTSTIGSTSSGGGAITPATATRNTSSVKTTMCSTPSCTVAAGIDQTVCAGTSITLSASGAQSYSWTNGVQNGIAFVPNQTQTYTVTGTSAQGCTATDQVLVTVLSSPTVNAGNDQSVCAGTSITLSASGAQSYSWTNGIQNGIAFVPNQTQTYTVTGTTAQGCTATDQVVVTVLSAPIVNAGNDQSVCAGTSITLSASGAQSYSWTNGIQNGIAFVPNQTQTYTVTGTSAQGCTATDQVVVTVNQNPIINAGADVSVCQGESILLNASGAVSLNWSNGVQNGTQYAPTSTETLTVNGTDAFGCQGSDQINITVHPPTTSVLNESALDSFTLNGQTYTQSGTYTQTVTNSNGCDSTITLNLQLSFTELNELNETVMRMYPNPSHGTLTIERSTDVSGFYYVIDQMGRTVLSGELVEKKSTLHMESVESGIYTIQVGKYRQRIVRVP